MQLRASLPWYDLPLSQTLLDHFWQRLCAHLVALGAVDQPGVSGLAPQLQRDTDPALQWRQPSLLLSQCCGPDLFTSQASELRPVARPVFGTLDCCDGSYFSHIVRAQRAGDSQQGGQPRLVVNAPSSRSGCGALFEWLQDADNAADERVSGSNSNRGEQQPPADQRFASPKSVAAATWGGRSGGDRCPYLGAARSAGSGRNRDYRPQRGGSFAAVCDSP